MTKLNHQHERHHKSISPQHEHRDPLTNPTHTLAHRNSPSSRRVPDRISQGHASLPTNRWDTSDQGIDKTEEVHVAERRARADFSILTLDTDRMSDHDPSSGDGDDEPFSTGSVTLQAQTQSQKQPISDARPYKQGGPQNTNLMSVKGPSSKAGSAQPTSDRKVHGQAVTSLPAEKVFPIQVGTEVFRLSGASISSDGPSYFTQWFEDQVKQNEETGGVRTLYIDRDTETFRDIARHLQGYYIKPRDGPHFVRLFADAQFYSLPRLISQLFESEIFIQIGEQHFQIPKDIFSDPGNSPNFFSLGFAVFFSTPSEVFPGLDRRGLLRPPPINPPSVPGRSAAIFAQLLHLLRGYPLHIRDETHRTELIRDCRYFHLRGLEQQIIAHDISYNLERQKSEICMRLNDLKPSGVSYRPDDPEPGSSTPAETGWVHYARPFVDEQSYELVIEVGGESTVLDLDQMRVDFHGKTKARVASLFQVVANKMGLPSNQPLGLIMLSGGQSKRSPSPGHSPLSEDQVRVRFDTTTDITLDADSFQPDWNSEKGRHMRTGAITSISIDDDMEDISSTPEESRTTSQSSSKPQKGTGPSVPTTFKSTRSHPHPSQSDNTTTPQPPQKKRKVEEVQKRFGRWTIRNAQWRLRVESSTNATRGKYEIVFVAVKVDAFTNERARNMRRQFLG